MNNSQQHLVSLENLTRIQAVARHGAIQSAVLSLAIWGAINLGTWYFMGTEDRQFLRGLGSPPSGSLNFLMYGGLFLGVGMLAFAALGYLSQTSISVVLNGLSLIAVGIWNVVYNFVAMGVLKPYGYDVNPISFWALLGLAQVIWGFQQLSLFGRARSWPSTRLPASELKALKEGLNDFSRYKESIEAGIVKASTMQQVLGIATLSRTTQYTGQLMEDCVLLVSAKLDDCITLDRRAMREAIFPEQTGTTLTVREAPNEPHLDLMVETTSLIAFKLWCGQALTLSDLQRVAPPAKKGAPAPPQTVPVSLFRPFLQGGEPQVRVAMLASLKGVAGPATRELVVAALEDPAAVVVAAAIDACRVTRIEDVQAQVVPHLAAADPLVRLAAVRYLEAFPDGDTRAALEQARSRENVPALREVIISVVGTLPLASDLVRPGQVPEAAPTAAAQPPGSVATPLPLFDVAEIESVSPVVASLDVSEATAPVPIITPSQDLAQRETVLPAELSMDGIEAKKTASLTTPPVVLPRREPIFPPAVSREVIGADRPALPLLCPHCQGEHPARILYCPTTGKLIRPQGFCPNCHQRVDSDWRYCGFCNYDLRLAVEAIRLQAGTSQGSQNLVPVVKARRPFPGWLILMVVGGVGLMFIAAGLIINNLSHRPSQSVSPTIVPTLGVAIPSTVPLQATLPASLPTPAIPAQINPTSRFRIVFASKRDGDFEIYAMDADGSAQTQLTNTQQADDTSPAWSPDGSKIVFVSNRNGNPEIYGMDVDGGSLIRLTHNTTSDIDPAWSPDGGKIVFASNRDDPSLDPNKTDIYIMDADGNNPTRLTTDLASNSNPTISPDGRKIAFNTFRDGNADIYVMDTNGSNQIRLTDHLGLDGFPTWSPDGRWIAFNSNRDGNWEIYVMDADGNHLVNLSNNPADDGFPAWTVDGGFILFASVRDGNYEIYRMQADGSNPTRLTDNPADDIFPDWRPLVP